MFAPAFGDKVEQGVNVGECETSCSLFVRHGWSEACDIFGLI